MLDESENWADVRTAKAELIINGRTCAADRMEVVTECDPSLRSLPLWECEARFNREVSEQIGKVSVGQVVISKVTADTGMAIRGGALLPADVSSHITMVVVSQRTEEDGSRSITARDARAVFDRDLVGFTSPRVLTAVQEAVAMLGLPVTIDTPSGEVFGTSWNSNAIVTDRNPVPLSALVLDMSRVVIDIEDSRAAVRVGGMPMSFVPAQTKTAEQSVRLLRTGIFGEIRDDLTEVPESVVMSWPSVRDDNAISSVTATIRKADGTVSKSITIEDGLIPVPVSLQTRSFGEVSSPWPEDESAGRMAIWAAAFCSMPEYRCRLIGNPAIQIGDRLSIMTEDGSRKNFIVRKHSLIFEGDLMSDLVLLDDTRYIIVDEDQLTAYSDASGTWKKVVVEPRDLVAILVDDGLAPIEGITGLPPTAGYSGAFIIGRFSETTMIEYTTEFGTTMIKVIVTASAPAAVSEMSAEDFA